MFLKFFKVEQSANKGHELCGEELRRLKDQVLRQNIKISKLEKKIASLQATVLDLNKKLKDKSTCFNIEESLADSEISTDIETKRSFESSALRQFIPDGIIDVSEKESVGDPMEEQTNIKRRHSEVLHGPKAFRSQSFALASSSHANHPIIKRADNSAIEVTKKLIDDFVLDLQKYAGNSLKAITDFLNRRNREELSADEIYRSIDNFADVLKGNKMIKKLWEKEEVLDISKMLEALHFELLYPHLFYNCEDSMAKSQQIHEKLTVLQNLVTADLLDVPFQFRVNSILLLLSSDIKKINERKTPLGKLRVVSCCFENLTNIYQATNGGKKPTADDLFPILVYIILSANPDEFYSNLEYIFKFIRPRFLLGENGYLLTNMQAALIFLENLDPLALTKGMLLVKKGGDFKASTQMI